MKITYDPYADAAYIYLDTHPQSPGCISRSVQLSEDVSVDFGTPVGQEQQEHAVGIEVLSASENMGLSKDVHGIPVEILGKPVPRA